MSGANITAGTIPITSVAGTAADLTTIQTIGGTKTFTNQITTTGGIVSMTDVSLGGNAFISKNLGVGTTAPQFTIDAQGGGVGCGRVVQFGSTGSSFVTTGGAPSTFNGGTVANDISLNARLLVSGDVSFNSKLYVASGIAINKDTIANGYVLDINGSAQGTAFNPTSDYRIKENPTPLDGTFTVDNLKPVFYFNTALQKNDIGLLAHELQEHYPYLVNGEKDGEHLQSVNYNGLIGLLIKEIQDAKQQIQDLKTQLDDLANK